MVCRLRAGAQHGHQAVQHLGQCEHPLHSGGVHVDPPQDPDREARGGSDRRLGQPTSGHPRRLVHSADPKGVSTSLF